MLEKNGTLIITLDFELAWGVRDKKALENYRENLLGVRSVIPRLLELFKEYNVHATWATVGFLFFENRDELIEALPAKRPNYVNRRLCPYEHIRSIGKDEEEDPLHYASSLIKLIVSYPHQEIASHTFSHYYCLEEGQDADTFKEDLEAAIRAAARHNVSIESVVFPRNQFNSDYISVCAEKGIKAYRGSPPSWIYKPRSEYEISRVVRALRLVDSYVGVSGCGCYSLDPIARDYPYNIRASHYLRPYRKSLRVLEPLRLRRIRSELTHAAKRGLVYHLWWHPHNFGANAERNLAFLRKTLDHYASLRDAYRMESLNMCELAERLIRE